LSSTTSDVDSGSNDNAEATSFNVGLAPPVADYGHIIDDPFSTLLDELLEGGDPYHWIDAYAQDVPPSTSQAFALSEDNNPYDLATASSTNLPNQSMEYAQVATSSAYTLEQYVFLLYTSKTPARA
jgi:hypothetical protein